MLVDDLEVGVGKDLAGAVVAARAQIEFCVLQCDIRGNDSFQSLDAFGDDFLPDAVTGDYCEFQICHVAIVARGRQVGRRCPYFGVTEARSRPKPGSRRHCHHLAASTHPGSIGTTRRHCIAQKPQYLSSKRCQSRQPVSISAVVVGSRAHIPGFHYEHPAQTTPTSVNPIGRQRISL